MIMNPVSYARYLDNISTNALSKKIGVSRQYISRLEQGLYDKMNPQVVKWTISTYERNGKTATPQTIEQLYIEWQWQKRESCRDTKALRPLTVTEFDRISQRAANQHNDLIYYHRIFAQWRNDYWMTNHAFCVDMCMHPQPVVEYEEGRTVTMPKYLKTVLARLGLIGEGFKTHER